jgi:hypothetical protein
MNQASNRDAKGTLGNPLRRELPRPGRARIDRPS